jgi:membrane-associated phospholipid phosphatase/tRNA A-37 threonylcarbamoyl transferase component Bud32
MTTADELIGVEPPAEGAPPNAERRRRRRRPTGAPPPLPRSIRASGKFWIGALAVLLVAIVVALASPSVREASDRLDSFLLRGIARMRTSWLADIASAIDRIGSGWAMTAVALGTIVALIVFKRWRHLFAFLGSVFVLEFIAILVYEKSARPRPYDVTIIGRWAGFSMPSGPVMVVAMVAMGITYTLVVPGRSRNSAKWLVGSVIGVFAAARLYLGVDHPTDVLVAATIGVAIPLTAFRFFTPNEVFPVRYRRGKTAHLDVGGRRGEAIRKAVQDQLGLTVLDIKPVGLEGSGGSTPLVLRVVGDADAGVQDVRLFGKLYAMSHVRADRWYKLGRTLLYGRLEDEAPFRSVRRLVQYEDYTLRVLRDAGIPTATPYGIVEITPEQEYLLLTEFFTGASEIGEPTVQVDDALIDEGLLLVRRLWDAGLAHRDIKPANLMVRDGRMQLIDVAFMEVRPSPWRQAVDLANMMLVLAVRTDAERVYGRALKFFTPDEIAEAFAATRGVASPTQLRSAMKQDGRGLLDQFRALAPARRPISLQRWSIVRVALALGLVVCLVLVVPQAVDMFSPAHDVPVTGVPECGTGDLMILSAQAVPSATQVPCIDALPVGWELDGVKIERGEASFRLDSDEGGDDAVTVTLRPPDQCSVADAIPVPSDQSGMAKYEGPERLPPGLRDTRHYVFEGGCVTYEFDFDGEASASLMFELDTALGFQPRRELVDTVRNESGLRLCGAGVPCPGGS